MQASCRDHVGTMQAPPRTWLLTFLPSSPGVPSSPWGHRLSVNTHLNRSGTGTVWDGDRQQGCGSGHGFFLPHPHLASVLQSDH